MEIATITMAHEICTSLGLGVTVLLARKKKKIGGPRRRRGSRAATARISCTRDGMPVYNNNGRLSYSSTYVRRVLSPVQSTSFYDESTKNIQIPSIILYIEALFYGPI